jgi:hypothetical protein
MKANKSDQADDRHVELTGKVVQKKFAKSSKSEHDAFYLETDSGDYHLRRIGGNPFSDPKLKELLGKKISARGLLNNSLFLIESILKVFTLLIYCLT